VYKRQTLYFVIVVLSFSSYEKGSLKKSSTYLYIPISYFIYQTYIWYISCLALIGAVLGKKISWGYLTRNGNVKMLENKDMDGLLISTNLKT
jgi:hypothetical protein